LPFGFDLELTNGAALKLDDLTSSNKLHVDPCLAGALERDRIEFLRDARGPDHLLGINVDVELHSAGVIMSTATVWLGCNMRQ
jgi:hypothetical protein